MWLESSWGELTDTERAQSQIHLGPILATNDRLIVVEGNCGRVIKQIIPISTIRNLDACAPNSFRGKLFMVMGAIVSLSSCSAAAAIYVSPQSFGRALLIPAVPPFITICVYAIIGALSLMWLWASAEDALYWRIRVTTDDGVFTITISKRDFETNIYNLLKKHVIEHSGGRKDGRENV